jgi:AcrR family transcriptional regulator
MCRKGYEATSVNEIADAVGLTKAGLYHYIRGKEQLLFAIMNYAMDVVDTSVTGPARNIADPELRLQTMLESHMEIVLKGVGAVTNLLEEAWALTPAHRRAIRARERAYFEAIRSALAQLAVLGKLRDVDPTVATFSLLGMVLWISRWYRRDGALSPQAALKDYLEIAMSSVLKTRSHLGQNESGAMPIALVG